MDTEQAKPNEKPYRVKEFADRADVSPNAVYEMIRRGEVQAVRFGRAIRIPRDGGPDAAWRPPVGTRPRSTWPIRVENGSSGALGGGRCIAGKRERADAARIL